jgi:hypothetical protein
MRKGRNIGVDLLDVQGIEQNMLCLRARAHFPGDAEQHDGDEYENAEHQAEGVKKLGI